MISQAPCGDGLQGSLRFTGVALEGTSSRGLSLVEGLDVTLDAQGITTEGPQHGVVRTIGWEQMSSAGIGDPAVLTDGTEAVTIVATSGPHQMRWFIPTAQWPAGATASIGQPLFGEAGVLTGSVAAADEPDAVPARSPDAEPVLEPPNWEPVPIRVLGDRADDHAPVPGDPVDQVPEEPVGAEEPPTGDEVLEGPADHDGPPHQLQAPVLAEQSNLAGRIHWVSPSRDRDRTTRARRRRQTVAIVLASVVSVAALAAVLILTVGGSHSASPPSATTPSTVVPPLSAANVTQGDVPKGWNVDNARTLSSQNSASWRQVFAGCMGLPASKDPLGQPPPVMATQQSPDFMGSPQPNLTELGSTAVEYSSSTPVKALVAEIADPRFAGCLGRAYAQTVGGGGTASAGVAHLSLEQVPGVIGTGYQVFISAAGSQDAIDIDYVVVSGGRITSQLVGMSVGRSFPSLVTAAAAHALEHRLAAASPS